MSNPHPNAKQVQVYPGAYGPTNEKGQSAHDAAAFYFADEGCISPVPFSPPFPTEEAARAGARAYAERFKDRVVLDS